MQVQADEITGKLEITCDSVSDQTAYYTRGDKDVTLTLTGVAITAIANENGKYETETIENGTTVTFTVTIPNGMTEGWSLIVGGARETASTATSSQTGTDSNIYTYVKTMDFSTNTVCTVQMEFNSQGGGTTPEIPKAPTDAISIEFWDNLGNLADYSAYSSTDDVTLEDGAVIKAIGAKIQYSYDSSKWYELSNETLDENLTYDGCRYVYNTTIDTVYLRVVSVKNGYLKSKALAGVSDGVQIEAGTVTMEEVYTVNQMGVCDFIYDNGKKNIVWSYDPAEYGADGTVTNGTVKVLSAVDESGQDVLNQTTPFGQTDKGGYVEISEGALVTVQIIPDYGYQFVSGSLNGNVVTASNEISTFTMPKTNLHLSALFKESKDQIAITADGVTSGTITGGANVIDSGNLKLTVANSGMSDTQKAAMQASTAASNVDVTNWLEVDLEQIVNKGNETDVWATDLEELKQKITITLNVGKGLDTTKEYVVVREHEGVYEQIPAVYDAATGTLTFQSDKFSNYAVGTVKPTGPTSGKTGGTTVLAKGKKFTDTKTKSKFKVTKADAKNGTVAYTGTTNSKAKTISIPPTVTVDGITYKVTSIADNALKNNKKITKVTISKNVISIGKNAFQRCKALTKITLPSKTTKIGANAFNGCTKLKTITIKSKKMTSKTISKKAFRGVFSKVTIKVPKGKAKNYKSLFRKRGLSKKAKVK